MQAPKIMRVTATLLALSAFAGSAAAAPPVSKNTNSCQQPAAGGREVLVYTQLAARIRGLSDGDCARLAAIILDESARAGLDPLLILAVIKVESAFNPKARSNRGAHGLMQLRHSTMRHELARSRLSMADPKDPILNVRAGVRYYHRLLRIFRNQDLALMAYNAGPNRISRYLRSGGVPDRFQVYPRRVRAEVKRLKNVLAGEPRLVVAVRESPFPYE